MDDKPTTESVIHDPQRMPVSDAAIAAIQFALETDDGLTFLRCWNYGDFAAIRREWSDAPDSVFVGADPLHPASKV